MIASITCDVVFKEATANGQLQLAQANRITEPEDRNKSEISQKNISKLDESKKKPVNSKLTTNHVTYVNIKSDKIEPSIKFKQSSIGQIKNASISSQFKEMNKLKSKQHEINLKNKSYSINDKYKQSVQSSGIKTNLITKKTITSKSFSSSNSVDKDKFFRGKFLFHKYIFI